MSSPPAVVFETMGTVVSLSCLGSVADATVLVVRAVFDELDDRFSLYSPDSEASRVSKRELSLRDASADYRRTYELAVDWRAATQGAFTPHRPDGGIDLSGVVKALAIHRSGEALLDFGVTDWCLNAGGDVLVAGSQEDGSPWVVGVVDPGDRTSLLTRFSADATHPAVATSGVAERGEHIWRIGADDSFLQVTVAAPDIVTADVLATAILAGGQPTLRLAESQYDIEVIAVASDGSCWASEAFRR